MTWIFKPEPITPHTCELPDKDLASEAAPPGSKWQCPDETCQEVWQVTGHNPIALGEDQVVYCFYLFKPEEEANTNTYTT